MAESVPLEDPETGKTSNQCCYFKMKVLNGHDSNEIINVAEDNFDERLFVFNDKSKSYVDLYKYVDIHIAENSTKETASKSLPWVHFAISNAKRNIHGAYHKIKGKYLQLYLD